MKIIISENQYTRVLLNENTLTERIWYRDDKITISFPNFNTKIGAFNLQYFGHEGLMLEVSNITDNSPVTFQIIRFNSPYMKVNEGKPSVVIPQKRYGMMFIDIDNAKDGVSTYGFTFFYVIPGSSPVFKSINIPVYTDKFAKCQQANNEEGLKYAIDWWKKWLNQPSTKDRFSKLFKYDKNTTEKHFAEYNKILNSNIKLEYVDSSKPNGGWVNPKIYKDKIFVNCRIAFNYDRESSISFLIHEIQHLLNNYHPFHNSRDPDSNIFSFYIDKISSVFDEPKKIDTESLKKYLNDMGFDDKSSSEIVSSYEWRLLVDELHLKNPNEVMSSLSELRETLNLKPNQKITKEMLINNANNSNVKIFISQWLYSGKSFEEFLNYSNSLAMRNLKPSDRNFA